MPNAGLDAGLDAAVDPSLDALADAVLAETPVLATKLTGALDDVAPRRALREVLRFLALCAASDRPLTPSRAVDDAWHELVLCTRTYARLCDTHFGRFLHHEPSDDDPRHARQFADTLGRYHLRFGVPDPRLWGEHPHLPSADCGGCEGDRRGDEPRCTSMPS
jgi:hypothetical protein